MGREVVTLGVRETPYKGKYIEDERLVLLTVASRQSQQCPYGHNSSVGKWPASTLMVSWRTEGLGLCCPLRWKGVPRTPAWWAGWRTEFTQSRLKAKWQHINYFQGQSWSVLRFKSGCAKPKVGPAPRQQERGEGFTGRSRSEASVWWVRGPAVALLGKRSWLCVPICSQESVSQIEVHWPWLRLWFARAATKSSESPQWNGLLFKYF